MAERPFCERCGRWAKCARTLSPFREVADPDFLRQRVAGGDTEALASFERATPGAPSFASIELFECAGCRRFHLLTVKAVERTRDADGEERHEETPILRNLVLDAAAFSRLAELERKVA